jgi:octaprenyl-diphosphate synthase
MLRTAPPKLSQIQDPIADRLDRVVDEFRRIVAADFDGVAEINDYLLQVRGKLFRPSLLLLCSEVGGSSRPEAEALAAVVELIHLSTLVHDDAVDHSVLRRGMPTVNAMWSHQVAIIMGDFLYSRSISELARLGDIEPVQILAAAANAMSVGELRQLASCDALDFSEQDYHLLIECKTASLISAACRLGALYGRPEYQEPLGRFGHELGMAFQVVDDLLDYTSDEAALGKPSPRSCAWCGSTAAWIMQRPRRSPSRSAPAKLWTVCQRDPPCRPFTRASDTWWSADADATTPRIRLEV